MTYTGPPDPAEHECHYWRGELESHHKDRRHKRDKKSDLGHLIRAVRQILLQPNIGACINISMLYYGFMQGK